MAHGSQERALGLVRRVGLAPCCLEFGDVVVHGVEAGVLAVDEEGDHGDLDVDRLAVLARSAAHARRSTGLDRLAGDAGTLRAHRLRVHDQAVDALPDRLVRGVAEEPLGGRVPARDLFVAVHGHDGRRADGDERFEI